MKKDVTLISCYNTRYTIEQYHLLSRSELFRDVLDDTDSDQPIEIQTTESNKQLSDYFELIHKAAIPSDNLLLITDLLTLTDKYKDPTSTKLIEDYLIINSLEYPKIDLYSLACRFQLSNLKCKQLNSINKDDLEALSEQSANHLGSLDLYELIKHSHKDRKYTDPDDAIQSNFNNYRSMY